MHLENQIALVNNPQEFTRLYNAVLTALYGDDFLTIDDDRPDGGNDGYLKSSRRVYAGHCFKRLQNQSLDSAIRDKMMSDLTKAVELKRSGSWEIDGWTFICNYPITESIGQLLLKKGAAEGIDVSWQGPGFLAEVLQRHPSIRALFPSLEVNEIMERLAALEGKYDGEPQFTGWTVPDDYACPTQQELRELADSKPDWWEFRLFAGLLRRGRAELGPKLLDHEVGYAPRSGHYLDERETIHRLSAALADAPRIIEIITEIYSEKNREMAFGPLGEPGSVTRISHLAHRTLGCIDELLNWATSLRALGVVDEAVGVLHAAARLIDQPIGEILEFIDAYSNTVVDIPRLVTEAEGKPVSLSLELSLTINSDAIRLFSAELERFQSSIAND